jgi:hypothetical protein
MSKLALGHTKPCGQWVCGALSLWEYDWGVKLTAQIKLVPRSRECESIRLLTHMSS